ncbi:MAG: nitrilase [Deinococcales bacterium]
MSRIPLATSQDGRFIVVNSTPEMVHDLENIQRVSFPDLSDADLMLAKHFASHVNIFPQGQHAVIDTLHNRVVASSSDIMLELDFNHYQHRFFPAVGEGFFTTHDSEAHWLYGADIGVLPEYRSMGLSSLLYKVRQDLVVRLGLYGHYAGAMPKGYGAVQEKMPIEAYLHEVIRNERFDTVLSIQLKRGYRIYGVIPDYLDDPSCANYGILIVWRNPNLRWS